MHPDSYFSSSFGLDFFVEKMGNVPDGGSMLAWIIHDVGQKTPKVLTGKTLVNFSEKQSVF